MRAGMNGRSHGFTLVELLIAIFILALGLISVFSLFQLGIYCTRENVDDTQASILAQSAFGQIRARRVADGFDTAAMRTLLSTAADTVACLRTPQDGFGPNDVRDTDVARYGWIATYARRDMGEVGTDTSPFDAVRVHVAVLRTGPYGNLTGLLNLADTSRLGRLVFQAGQRDATIVTEPATRDGFVAGSYVCDLRSGCFYRIRALRDKDANGAFDTVELDRRAEYDSDGNAFQASSNYNAAFYPGVVTVYDGMVSR